MNSQVKTWPMIHILYHANCVDGFTAAWVVRKALLSETVKEIGESNAMEFHACSYGCEIPDSIKPEDTVCIVDFSMSREQTHTLLNTVGINNLIILDHHKSAIEKLDGIELEGILDTSRSGAMLAWNYFFPHLEVPELVKYVQDYDLWQFKLPNSKEISAYISTLEFTFKQWDELEKDLNDNAGMMIAHQVGATLLRKLQMDIESAIKFGARIETVAGYNVPVLNCPRAWASEAGNMLCKKFTDAKFAMTWIQNNQGDFNLSFRSIGEFDVSKIAEIFGGGGHRNAAGANNVSKQFFHDNS